jgi:hypothetical protein
LGVGGGVGVSADVMGVVVWWGWGGGWGGGVGGVVVVW